MHLLRSIINKRPGRLALIMLAIMLGGCATVSDTVSAAGDVAGAAGSLIP